MSVLQYPKPAYFLILNNEPLELGSYEIPSDGYLRMVQMRLFHRKSGPYSYGLKIEVSSKAGGPVITSSSVETFSDTVTGQLTSDWLGDAIFTFPDYKLKTNRPYFLRLVSTGYTRPDGFQQNTAYLGVWCDWFEPIGLSNTGGARAAFGVME